MPPFFVFVFVLAERTSLEMHRLYLDDANTVLTCCFCRSRVVFSIDRLASGYRILPRGREAAVDRMESNGHGEDTKDPDG